MNNLAALHENFERDGFVLASGLFPEEACAAMRAMIRARLPREWDLLRPSTWRGRAQDCCTNLPLYARKGLLRYKDKFGFQHDPAAAAAYENRALVETANALMPAPYERMRLRGLHPVFPLRRSVSLDDFFGGRLSRRGAPRALAELRIPRPPQAPIFGHLEVHMLDLGAIAYFSDTPAHGGALAVWPGSHKVMQHAVASREGFLPTAAYDRLLAAFQKRAPLKLAAQAGDVVFFHPRLMHSNTVNYSKTLRYAALIDFYAEGWRARDETIPLTPAERSQAARLETARDVIRDPLVRTALNRSRPSLLRRLLVEHPAFHKAIEGVSKDVTAAGRAMVSGRSRKRRDGDCWLIIGQAPEYRRSVKLDTYGEDNFGAYEASMDGARFKSVCGLVVEPIPPRALPASLRVEGRFDKPHYVRVIRTRNPIRKSDILFEAEIPAGADYAEFSVESAA